MNKVQEHIKQQQEEEIGQGDMTKDDGMEFKCHDNANSESEEELETGLRSFRESPCWGDDGDDSEHSSTDKEEE